MCLNVRGYVTEEKEVSVLPGLYIRQEESTEGSVLLTGRSSLLHHISSSKSANSVASSPPVPRGLSLFRSRL